MSERSDHAVEIAGLSRRFHRIIALDAINLEIPRGTVFGLVGENGAGKTTLIKHLLGLLKPQSGSVRVLGRDPVRDPVGVLTRVGYLSEDRDLPDWMRIDEVLRYLQAFFPTWDAAFAETLRNEFDLDPRARINTLSQGQRARVALLAALAYRPELLVLDEPSTGLDPIVRREILAAIIRTVAEEGRTVLFSSHLLDEVERMSDYVALLDHGRIALCEPLDSIKANHHCLTLRFDEPLVSPPAVLGASGWEGFGREWSATCRGSLDLLQSQAAEVGARIVEEHTPSLDDIFVASVGFKPRQTVEN